MKDTAITFEEFYKRLKFTDKEVLNKIKEAYEYGVKVFGVTVHYVDSGMDTGRIIDQEAFHIENGVSLEKVENKIHEIEHVLYPRVVKLMCEGK